MRNDNDFVMVPVRTILQTVTGSCDFDSVEHYRGDTEDEQRTSFWEDVIVTKAADTGFGHLVDSILENGFTGSAIGWNDGYITEGHHRLVAAILLGMDEVPTTRGGRCGDYQPFDEEMTYFSSHWAPEGSEHPIEIDL